MVVSLDDVLTGVQKWARPCLLAEGMIAKNNCIQSSRTLQDVFMHFGYYARPLTVHAYIYNAELLGRMERGEPYPPANTPEYAEQGLYGMAVDTRSESGTGWGGHLVLALEHPEHGLLIVDGSIDQFTRPDKGIDIPLMVAIADVPENFDGETQDAMLKLDTGAGVVYRSQPKDHTYVNAPDWMQYSERPYYLEIRRKIIQAVGAEAELAASER